MKYLFLKSLSGFLTVWRDFIPAKESFSRRILMPMSMRTQFPLQFNTFNVRVVAAGLCVTLFNGSNSLRGANNLFRDIKNWFRKAKSLLWQIENSFWGANNLFRGSKNFFRGEIYNRLWIQINPVLFLILTSFGKQWTTIPRFGNYE